MNIGQKNCVIIVGGGRWRSFTQKRFVWVEVWTCHSMTHHGIPAARLILCTPFLFPPSFPRPNKAHLIVHIQLPSKPIEVPQNNYRERARDKRLTCIKFTGQAQDSTGLSSTPIPLFHFRFFLLRIDFTRDKHIQRVY